MVISNNCECGARSSETYRGVRKSLGLTMAELAEKLEVSVATIANRENGRSAITSEAWLALECIYRVAEANSHRKEINDLQKFMDRFHEESEIARVLTHTSNELEAAWDNLDELMSQGNPRTMPTQQEVDALNIALDRCVAERLELAAHLPS